MTQNAVAHVAVRPPLARYDGALEFRVAAGKVDHLHVTPPLRLFRPYAEPGEPRTVVVANVAGGVVGGDRLTTSINVGVDESLLVTTQAAEKVYRSDGATAEAVNRFYVARGGVLEMLSSGTILFDGSRFHRTTTLDIEDGARASYSEIVVFGRIARDEVLTSGDLRDRVRLMRSGRLVWADDLRLAGSIDQLLSASAGFAGARALGTLLLVGSGCEALVPGVRAAAETVDTARLGVTAIDPETVVVRVMAADPAAARSALAGVWREVRAEWLGRPARMPTIWAV